MRKSPLAVAAALLLAAAARPASAQADAKQFYAAIGFAYGDYDLAANGYSLASTYKSNIAYYGELGMRIKPMLSVGFEADYYTKSSQGASINVWYYNAAFAYYPSAGRDLWFKLLAGYANTSENNGGGYGTGSKSQGGFAMGLGAGYDLRLGNEKKFAVVPFIQYLAQLSGGSFSGSNVNYESRLFMVGAAVGLLH